MKMLLKHKNLRRQALIGQSNNLSDANEDEKMKVRDSFNKALEGKLKKRFDMNINDKIEKRALNRVQINHILDVLINNKHNEKNYYNFRNTYSVQTIDGTNYLYENQENKRKKIIRLSGVYHYQSLLTSRIENITLVIHNA